MDFAVDIAIRAARVQLQQGGRDPSQTSAEDALSVLAELAHSDADLLASIWYTNASPKQIKNLQG